MGLRSDAAGALAQIDAILPTLKAGLEGDSLVNQIARSAAKDHPGLVLNWLAKIPLEFRVTPAISAARDLATTDPQAALEWCRPMASISILARNTDSVAVAGRSRGRDDRGAGRDAGLARGVAGRERSGSVSRAGDERRTLAVAGRQTFQRRRAVAMRLFNELSPEAQAQRRCPRAGARKDERSHRPQRLGAAVPARSDPGRCHRRRDRRGFPTRRFPRGCAALQFSTDADRDAALRGLAETMIIPCPLTPRRAPW